MPDNHTKNKQVKPLITVIPGDDVSRYIDFSQKSIKIGDGLRFASSNQVLATAAGRLEHRKDCWFVLQNCKRYIPTKQDRVVGVVEDRMGSHQGADLYRVNIGGPHPALLSSLQFEGATKRNRPHLKTGMLVYARVLQDSNVMDPMLSCILGPKDAGVPRKDWMTDEGLYGELKGGTLMRTSLGLARELLDPNNIVLEELSKLPFEVCIGVNGFVWVHAAKPAYTILIQNAITNSEVLTEEQTRGMVRSLIKTVQEQLSKEEEDESDQGGNEHDKMEE